MVKPGWYLTTSDRSWVVLHPDSETPVDLNGFESADHSGLYGSFERSDLTDSSKAHDMLSGQPARSILSDLLQLERIGACATIVAFYWGLYPSLR